MSNPLIGIIAEDDTDCNTVREIIHRVLGTNIGTKKWASKGCGSLKRKLNAHLQALSNAGCNVAIIIHDLDRNPHNDSLNNELELRRTLEKLASNAKGIRKHICIPIEELEAWFWCDQKVISHVGGGKGKAHASPHLIKEPKEELIKLSVGENRKPRYSTNTNVELAAMLDLELCSNRCPSFNNLLIFLRSL
jgi:hypothetical protein